MAVRARKSRSSRGSFPARIIDPRLLSDRVTEIERFPTSSPRDRRRADGGYLLSLVFTPPSFIVSAA
jgi:hypothetical protein